MNSCPRPVHMPPAGEDVLQARPGHFHIVTQRKDGLERCFHWLARQEAKSHVGC